jgi:hypothetical protein
MRGLVRLAAVPLAGFVIGYGFVAAMMPVWLLLAPRDYLSTFLKIGTVVLLAIAIIVIMRPEIKMPALTRSSTAPARSSPAAVPVRVHHDRLRRDLRLPRADLVRHDAEAAPQRGGHPADRLRQHDAGVLRRDHGDDRRDAAGPGRVLRDQQPAGVAGGTPRPRSRRSPSGVSR